MADKKKKENKKEKEKKNVYSDKILASVQPVVSEKSYLQANEQNKYHFKVPMSMNKIEAGKIVSDKYNVTVLNVNSIVRPGKMSVDWQKGRKYRKSDKKKVIVTLKEGDRIEEFFNI